MDEDELTQLTQGVLDPRREGKNNSGLCVEDISDVMCILHPCSLAAFKVVAETAQRSPQHVLQTLEPPKYDFKVSPDLAEEQETFIVDKTHKDPSESVMDLALRFSSDLRQPAIGYVFGRNPHSCDIVVTGDAHKRVSNTHFCIYFNDSGVLMLRDMSTNGTVVDQTLLKHKAGHEHSQTHMLSNGSIIQVLSPNQADIIKFIVRIPSREGYFDEYDAKFQAFMHRYANAQNEWRRLMHPNEPTAAGNTPVTMQPTNMKSSLIHNQYGMHWSGGSKYNVVGLVGKGAFASVYQLATKSDGTLFAAKELEKRKFIKNGILDRKLDNEMTIMRSISHPNIVKYVDYQDVAAHLYIIMEFLPYGDLQQYLTGTGLVPGTRPLPEKMAQRMAEQVLDALNYLHDRMITHRDIKPDNILIADLQEDSFTVKLSDFGLSKVVKDNDTFLKTFCGTLLYCAPEVFPFHGEKEHNQGTKRARKGAPQANSRSYSQAVDVWSFGAVLWYALCLSPPFEGVADKTGRAMFDKIMKTPLDVRDLVRAGTSDEAVALLVEMLNLDPMARPTPFECLHHRWFGNTGPVPARPPTAGLGAIAEEEGSMEPDLSQLSIYEKLTGKQSDLSLDSADLDFFQSKRFKSNAMDYRDQDSVLLSSSEVVPGHMPASQGEVAQDPAVASKPPKLFGEISRSNLEGIDPALNQVINDEVEQNESHQVDDEQIPPDAPRTSPQAQIASSSLLATEAGVRDMHMGSPFSSAVQNAPAQPGSPTSPRRPQTGNISSSGNVDVTPKAAQAALIRPFDRQIRLPLTASYYYDPRDPSTHNVEYASKVSGHDFSKEPQYMRDDSSAVTTQLGSSVKSTSSHGDASDHENATSTDIPAPPTAIDSPRSPPCLGRLISTPDSFAQLTLEIRGRLMSWGRAPSCTIVYPHQADTRIPKHALTVYFHAPGIETLPADHVDFTHLPDLYTGIITHASAGIWVNGVPLKKGDEAQKRSRFGRLYTGDEITVCLPYGNDEPGLKFICEFFCGEGKQSRPYDRAQFAVETAPMNGKGKGFNKESVRANTGAGGGGGGGGDGDG